MKILLSAITFITFASNSYAFHAVTEILPSGKLLICKDYEQVKKGELVEVYSRVDSKSLSDFSLKKTSEFKLPSAGQKIKLNHKDFHQNGKKSTHHEEALGVAVVSYESLEGQERSSGLALGKSRFSKATAATHTISKEEALKIQDECFVAIPSEGLKINEKASVSW